MVMSQTILALLFSWPDMFHHFSRRFTVLISQSETQRGEASYEVFQPWKIFVVYLLYSFTVTNLV